MPNSLRSRLLISYLAVITTALFIVSLALLAISATQTARLVPALRQLGAVAQGARRELVRLVEQGADLGTIRETMSEVAANNEARIVLLNRGNGRLFFDSQSSEAALGGIAPGSVARPRGEFTELDPNLPVGRFRAPDGSRWLIFAQPVGGAGDGRLLVIVARREPSALLFFRETFLRPLCQAGLVAFLLSLLLAVWISRSVARPLQRLATATESVAQGDYEQELPLSGPDEVQRVAGSFNAMASQVATTQNAQRDFVTNVSHDLKTPLTSIRGWSQALLDGTAASAEQQQRAAGIIHAEAERMERMVDQLLDLARIESGQLELAREPVDLHQLIAEIHQNFTIQAQEQGVRLTLDARPVPPVPGDHDRLAQVFNNLVDNALAHTPPGGRIQLSLHPHGPTSVEILVQDTGAGIPSEDLSRVFERFYQVEKSRARPDGRRGSGLGLAIAKELVEAHGGRIEARSQPGQGSTFIVRLPTDRPPNPTIAGRR